MKIKLVMKRTHLDSDEKMLLHNGEALLKKQQDVMHIEYMEDGCNKVNVKASNDGLSLIREAQHRSELVFVPNKKTVGKVISEYGVLPIELFTHKYIRNHNMIMLEYDVMVEGEVCDRFRMIWNMKEDIRA